MTVLKGIPAILSPELLCVLAQMGHGDEIVLADANFPSASVAKQATLIRADGHQALPMLKAILQLLPLDQYVPSPAFIMRKEPSDKDLPVPIVSQFQAIVSEAHGKQVELEEIERMQFYERAKTAFAVVATGETALYGNIILKKGVIPPSA
eukprot:m.238601 g.238601  ORF g.238601 m.238601 type:complete len:151 (+) comp13326_c0_seq1:32-484(+)